MKLEPGVAVPLTAPQSQLYEVGGSLTLKALFGLNKYLDIGPSVTLLQLPAEAELTQPGVAWTFGGGVRLKRPHDAPGGSEGSFAISPWAEADALYVRTGVLNRPGFAVAAGLSLPIGETRMFWAGPFVRYLHIIQRHRAGYDNHDAKLLSVGVSLEIGPGREREPIAAAEVRTITQETISCPDRDKDGVPDNVDRCPNVAGPMESWGCPEYKKVVIKRDKLELKEKLYFAWNQATLEEASFPVLDEVAQALKDNPDFRVQIEGHTDSSGAEDHNQTLSEKRAETVLDYLVAHGVAKERLVSKGFSSSVPLDTNNTVTGRENNRRVEFVVNFNILNDGSTK
ncbi:OmpA family protein [Hyalangium sp.]|uniref:OmpA family protein n=1 Tax=Hyalangium sp. TaxID=2028555 RepID=UPI002D4F0451|nr:OmpA family protein [Hyalangium sp.]HYH98804.1 OmpA family protein [Hyalangium sp.]